MFCDFENIALGVRDANYAQFDIGKVIERLLLKGNIVVKKAYCDWERYKDFKASMHEASFELIEIPHVRQSGKNSADIRMVVDALDLCYTKEHVDTFVILSGDSDFSPLVSKLRENDKIVIGVGVKNSTSDLLIANCDEFIYYDDLVRRQPPRRKDAPPRAGPQAGAGPDRQGRQARRRGQEAGGVGPDRRDLRGPGRGARRGGEDLGLHDQADAETPQTRLQRVLLRLPVLRPAAGGGPARGHPGAGTRREVRRLHHQELPRSLTSMSEIIFVVEDSDEEGYPPRCSATPSRPRARP